MSHEEERVNRARMGNKAERAPPHWLNPLISRTATSASGEVGSSNLRSGG
jgi:hypothetical protein